MPFWLVALTVGSTADHGGGDPGRWIVGIDNPREITVAELDILPRPFATIDSASPQAHSEPEMGDKVH
jgi:hypothetical protein